MKSPPMIDVLNSHAYFLTFFLGEIIYIAFDLCLNRIFQQQKHAQPQSIHHHQIEYYTLLWICSPSSVKQTSKVNQSN